MSAQVEEPVFIAADWAAPATVVAVTTTRADGSNNPDNGDISGFNLGFVGANPEKVRADRGRLARALGSGLDFQWLQQVHGKQVAQAARNNPACRADAVYTTESNLACCVLTADCLPVFFSSVRGDAVAVAHAGWRGLAAGVLENTVNSLPVAAHELLVWLGPAIGPCHFEVGPEVRDAFLSAATGISEAAVTNCFRQGGGNDRLLADLYELARLRLKKLGVAAVSGGGLCTYCDPHRFYSYRREGVTGRMASVIYRRPLAGR